jgi:hypothetical protein
MVIVYGEVAVTSITEVRFMTEGVAPEFVVRSHGPPDRSASPARAPPV